VVAFSPAAITVDDRAVLPERMQIAAQKYLRSEDRIRYLSVRVLLRRVLVDIFQLSPDAFDMLTKTELGQPVLGGGYPCISITHSGPLVACAVSPHPLGIDLECGPVIDLKSCLNALPPFLAKEICDSVNPDQAFLEYWTRIESALKGTGLGFLCPLDGLRVADGLITVNNQCWYTRKLDLQDTRCVCHLATLQPASITMFHASDSHLKHYHS